MRSLTASGLGHVLATAVLLVASPSQATQGASQRSVTPQFSIGESESDFDFPDWNESLAEVEPPTPSDDLFEHFFDSVQAEFVQAEAVEPIDHFAQQPTPEPQLDSVWNEPKMPNKLYLPPKANAASTTEDEPLATQESPQLAQSEEPKWEADAEGGQLDAEPVLIHAPAPHYPLLARRSHWEGTVRCRLIISENGIVTEVRVDQSSGYALLDQAAVDALLQWRFKPGLRQGFAAVLELEHRVSFRLNAR